MKEKSKSSQKKKAPIVAKLQTTINELVVSPRYKVIQNLKPSTLFKSGTIAASLLEDYDISELVALGAKGIAEIQGLSARDLEMLLEILGRFSVPFADDACAASGVCEAPTALIKKGKAFHNSKDAGLLAIEKGGAELEFAEKKQKLKKIESDLLSSKLLSDYWEEDWPRAPFEECLTFKQFSSIDTENLIKKRSFDVSKMGAISKAIDKFLGEHDTRFDRRTSSINKSGDRQFFVAQQAVVTFESTALNLPLITRNLIRFFEYQCAQYHSSTGPMKVFFAHLPISLKAHEAAILAMSDNGAPSLSRRLLGVSREDFERHLREGQEKIRQLFQHSCGKIYASWTSALLGMGASEEDLFAPYMDPAFDSDFQHIVFRAVLLSMEAIHPAFLGETFTEMWTINSKMSEFIAQSLIDAPQLSDDMLQERVRALFPNFPTEKVFELVKKERETAQI